MHCMTKHAIPFLPHQMQILIFQTAHVMLSPPKALKLSFQMFTMIAVYVIKCSDDVSNKHKIQNHLGNPRNKYHHPWY